MIQVPDIQEPENKCPWCRKENCESFVGWTILDTNNPDYCEPQTITPFKNRVPKGTLLRKPCISIDALYTLQIGGGRRGRNCIMHETFLLEFCPSNKT